MNKPLILIADDAALNRKYIATILQKEHRIKEACDATEALEKAFDTETPDLILLDLRMPGGGGQAVLAGLRGNPRTRHVPAIVLTSDSSEESERECLELGADDFLTRPFRMHALILRVKNLLHRRRLEQELAESNDRAGMVFEVAPAPMLVIDSTGKVLQANGRAEQVFGCAHGALIGESAERLLTPSLIRQFVSAPGVADQQFALQLNHDHEARGIRCNGEEFPLLVNISQFVVDGEIQAIIGINDLTERKNYETRLHESDEQYLNELAFNQAIVESSGAVLIIIDVAGRIERVNAAVEKLTGFNRADLIGHPVWDWLIPPESIDAVKAVFTSLKTQSLPNEYENEWLTRDGGRIPFHWYNTVLTDTRGQVTHIVAQGHDIRTLKANESVIRQDKEQQTLLRRLIEDSFIDGSLGDTLKRCLNRILSISWMQLLPKGAIFLAKGNDLQLIAAQDLSPHLVRACAKVPFGHCLCGAAAASKQLQYAQCVDDRHQIRYDDMEDHGHYSLPLKAGETTLGVLALYLPLNFERDLVKEEFLLAVGNVIAGIIRRKLDESHLREREMLYRKVVETSTDGFFTSDASGRLLEANASYARMSGYSLEELAGMHITDIEALESHEEVQARIGKVIVTGSDLFETKHRRKDGRIWPVEVSVSYLPHDGGRFFAFIRDIGPREEMRLRILRSHDELEELVAERTAELVSSQQQLASIIDNLPAILFIKDRDGRYLKINRRFERDLGLPRETVIGHTDLDLFPTEVARSFMVVDQQVIASGNVVSQEEIAPTKEGIEHTYLTTKIPFLDEHGISHSMLGIAVDITEIKLLQTHLSRAQTIAHVGSWRYDIASRTISGSEETRRIFGITDRGPVAIGRFLTKVPPQDRRKLKETWKQALQGRPFDVETRITLDKDLHWVRWLADIKHGSDGLPILADGSVQDITEIKRTRQALEAAVTEAHRVARLKSEFLANMSHEIRTPLNGILGLAQVGERQFSGQASHRLFNHIIDSGKLLLGIVNDILDFSKIEAGKLHIERVDVELARLVQHVSVMCTDRASAKGFLFRIETAADLPPRFKGDPLRLAQVLINLIGNAIKFTQSGEVALTIARSGEEIVFSICDTGIGMTAEQVANLFKPFEQADGSITRRFGGTGLGLAITQRLVGMMGGKINVWSEPGIGSTFSVHLPLEASTALPDQTQAAETREKPGGKRSLAGMRVLGAEDNIVNRMVLEDILTMEGATFLCAEDGAGALEIVKRQGADAWDIVLTDIHMPVMSGHELAEKLLVIAPDLPIVGVTAHAMVEEQKLCIESGMVAHVAKPIVIEELLNTIRHHARPGWQKNTGLASTDRPIKPAETPGEEVAASSTIDTNHTALIDWEALHAMYQGREAFVGKLLAMLIESHAATPEKMRTAVREGDFSTLGFLAHSFAGVSGSVRATTLHLKAKEIESRAKAKEEAAFDLVEPLCTLTDYFFDEIRHYLAQRD